MPFGVKLVLEEGSSVLFGKILCRGYMVIAFLWDFVYLLYTLP